MTAEGVPDYSDDAVFPELWNTLAGSVCHGQV
jgi:hypothetical protein